MRVQLKKPKVVHKTIILNGTKVWLTVLSILVTYGGGSIWWAATQTQTLHDVKVTVDSIQTTVEKKADLSLLNEVKSDLKEHIRKG